MKYSQRMKMSKDVGSLLVKKGPRAELAGAEDRGSDGHTQGRIQTSPSLPSENQVKHIKPSFR